MQWQMAAFENEVKWRAGVRGWCKFCTAGRSRRLACAAIAAASANCSAHAFVPACATCLLTADTPPQRQCANACLPCHVRTGGRDSDRGDLWAQREFMLRPWQELVTHRLMLRSVGSRRQQVGRVLRKPAS